MGDSIKALQKDQDKFNVNLRSKFDDLGVAMQESVDKLKAQL